MPDLLLRWFTDQRHRKLEPDGRLDGKCLHIVTTLLHVLFSWLCFINDIDKCFMATFAFCLLHGGACVEVEVL